MFIRSLFAVAAFALPAFAQTVNLTDGTKSGDHFRYVLSLEVSGKLKIDREGKPETLPMRAEASHEFLERIDTAEIKAIRHYLAAKSSSTFGTETGHRDLRAERRLVLALRTKTGLQPVCPEGPFTRDEFELVGEHFDTLALPGLFPKKEVAVNDPWSVPDGVVQAILHFDSLGMQSLKGTLIGATDDVAKFAIAGDAEGTELGATVKVKVKATGTFDRKTQRVSEIDWQQEDVRSQGPASPATELTAKIQIKRTPVAEEPKELSEKIRAKVPTGVVPDSMTRLAHADAEGRYTFTYPRTWLIVGQTQEHIVFRMLEKGEFAAQLTIATWKKAAPGEHAKPEDFKTAVAKLPGWVPGKVIEDAEMPASPGRWGYKLSAEGKQDGTDVIQTFYLFSGAAGDQIAVTVMSRSEKVGDVAAQETELLKSLVLPGKK